MSDFEWKEIRESFGGEIERYCRNFDIVPQKTEHGSYMIPNDTVLNQLKKICNESKQGRKKRRLTTQHVFTLNSAPASRVANKKRLCLSKNGAGIAFSGSPAMRIGIKDSCEKSPTLSTSKISKNHILNSAKSGWEIVERVIEVDFRTNEMHFRYQFSELAKVLERFQRNHRRLNYTALLTQLLDEKLKGEENVKQRSPISRRVLREFFRVTLEKLLLPELIGKYKNKRKILKAVNGLLDTARFEMFDLGRTIDNLNLQSISWLKLVEEEKKWQAVGKLVKWLFCEFILPLLHSQFHVMEDPSLSYKRIFIRIVDWCRMRRKYCKTIKRKGIIKPNLTQDISLDVPSAGILKLFPRDTGIRPIVKRRYSNVEKYENVVMLQFLEQLYLTHSELMSDHHFHKRWRDIVNKHNETGRGSLYLISCDIRNAFGSIIQEQLYDIIKVLSKDLPETLYFEWYIYLRPGRKCETSKRYFSNMKLTIPTGVMFARKRRKPQVIRKEWLLKIIVKNIFCQNIMISGRRYWIKKGLTQGSAISPILANIYYNYVIQQKMSRFLRDGHFIRYADDLLYSTECEKTSLAFLQVVEKGFPEFNCWFKSQKTQTNVPSFGYKISKNIKFIGYKIYCNILEITPTFREAHPRHLLSYIINADKDLLQVFKCKLFNAASLKLTSVVLDITINSEKTIRGIIKEACVRLAWRARILILYIFKDIEDVAQDIFRIIMLWNRKIRRKIVRLICSGTDIQPKWKQREWHRFVGHTLLRSYKEVFRREVRLRYSFKSQLTL